MKCCMRVRRETVKERLRKEGVVERENARGIAILTESKRGEARVKREKWKREGTSIVIRLCFDTLLVSLFCLFE